MRLPLQFPFRCTKYLLLPILAGCPATVDPCPPGSEESSDACGDDDDGSTPEQEVTPAPRLDSWEQGPLTGFEDSTRGCEGIVGVPGTAIGFRPVAYLDDQVPVALVSPLDGTGRLFVGTHQGMILSVTQDGTKSVLLDVRDATGYGIGEETGLYSVAPHPDFAVNGQVFVARSDLDNTVLIERYTVAGDPAADPLDPGTRIQILAVPQPTPVHQGGQLAFGPDGLLYIGLGDGGPTQGAFGASQELSLLRGKILRIDVDGAAPYTIPADNPFWGDPDARKEIWAMGLRNPWRFSFDRQSGAMWIGDVGENRFEELNIGRAGANYGWPYTEGDECFPPDSGCDPSWFEQPVWVYGHDVGAAVIGGEVYRGCTLPDLWGTYLYSDFGTQGSVLDSPAFDGLEASAGAVEVREFEYPLYITSWGLDARGEIYVADLYGHQILKIVPAAQAGI